MKKVLITGSNGMIGQKLVEYISKNQDFQLIASSQSSNKIRYENNYQFVQLDITNYRKLKSVLFQHKPNIVINCAAIAQPDACEKNKSDCWKINVEAVEDLVGFCNEIDAHFIHLSSDFVFDGENKNRIETDKTNPKSYYGLSKLEAEKIVIKKSKKWSIVRTILVFGFLPDLHRSNIVLLVKEMLETKKIFRPIDNQFRTPTLVDDLALAINEIAIRSATGMYHIAGNDFMSIIELSEKVADFFGLDKSLIIPISAKKLNEPAMRPLISSFDMKKANTDLDYKPHSFLEGLEILKNQMK
ncbi:MAG: SDR family oxidoreductase [Bacteroidetes bacterium]|jgi:dTDP-4-dehydrorhamnose reductase|nr:SDR family oxidoreductase [Bacteroidota bacterium]MBT6687993.1 SDR family oxidoreductase [Bacteroidota bacterium]MBT7144942.1 SDR family oxidoreductase [Bacteroidota bacterium]MBT7492112.1 SDR family oxidoreductase [Bacteroidota bacterium]